MLDSSIGLPCVHRRYSNRRRPAARTSRSSHDLWTALVGALPERPNGAVVREREGVFETVFRTAADRTLPNGLLCGCNRPNGMATMCTPYSLSGRRLERILEQNKLMTLQTLESRSSGFSRYHEVLALIRFLLNFRIQFVLFEIELPTSKSVSLAI